MRIEEDTFVAVEGMKDVELGSSLACICDGGRCIRKRDCWECNSCGQAWALDAGDRSYHFWNSKTTEKARRAVVATQEALRTFEDLHDADVCSQFLVWLHDKGYRIPIRGDDTRHDIIDLFLKGRRNKRGKVADEGQAQKACRQA